MPDRSAPVILDARVVAGSGGGPDKTILNSPRYLAADGYRMLCAYLHPPGDPGFEQIAERAAAKSAPLFSVPDHGPFDWRVVPKLLDICRRERVTVWHGHDYKTNALGLLLNRFQPMRLVTTLHGWVHRTRKTPIYYGIDRFSLRFYERVICVSDDLFRSALKAGVPEHRCTLLENGIDLTDYRRTHTPEQMKRRLGVRPDRLLIGAVGRLSAEKGFDVLIEAFARLFTAGINADLAIIGEGAEEANLRSLIHRLGLTDRVTLLGYRSDVAAWYQAMDVYALSSYREGLPNVLLEAMALGVPVIATRVNGVPRLVRHGANGLLADPGSADALADGLAALLADAALRDRFARSGRSTVEKQFSFANRMGTLRRIYDRLLEPQFERTELKDRLS